MYGIIFQEKKGALFMDIGSLSSLSSLANSASASNMIQVAMLSKSMDTFEESGADMVKMMESSVSPHLGQNIDISV